jgi:hypothetical protein
MQTDDLNLTTTKRRPWGPPQGRRGLHRHGARKMSRLVAEFAAGEINRTQFHHVYDRYQRQIMTVAQMITESDPPPGATRSSKRRHLPHPQTPDGQGPRHERLGQRKRNADRDSGRVRGGAGPARADVEQLPLGHGGDFPGRDAQHGDGERQWLCFVPATTPP